MKKKFISAMAISLCLCMGAMVGCGDNKNNSSSSSSPKEPLTKDEILAAIGDAYAATKAYKGGYTVTGTNNWESKDFEDEEKETGVGTMELTADTNQKLVYYKTSGEEGYELEKVLKNGADYIRYREDKSGEEEAEKTYTKYTETYATYYINEYYAYENMIDNYISAEMFDIESIDTYNAAYAKVFADSAEEVAAGTADEESEYYGCTASGSGTVSVVETEDGAYVLTTKITMELSNSVENMTMASVQETVVTAKDGKLTGWKESEETTETKKISDTETQTSIEKEEMVYTVTYAFDQAKYDSAVVTLPETVEPRNYYSKDVTVVVNGIESDDNTYVSGNSIAVAVDNLMGKAMETVGANAQNATVTLYKDAAYTQALDGATMTEADFYALEKVYVKVELKEGYVLLNYASSATFGADVTAEQKLIFGAMLDYSSYQILLSIVPAQESENLTEMAEDMGATKVMVNGTAYTEERFTMESGETYEVNFVSEIPKAQLNIFMMLG